MNKDIPTRKCPSCGSVDLIYGTKGVYRETFIPRKRFMMMGYTVHAFVCLKCGYLGHYLDPKDMLDLQRNRQSL